MKARYPEPDRSVGVAEVGRYPGEACDFVLMENELGAVDELVLCKPRRRPFVEFHERLDIVEQSIESLGGNFVFSRQFWGHDVTFSRLQCYETWNAAMMRVCANGNSLKSPFYEAHMSLTNRATSVVAPLPRQ